jgi:hypothetical protein
MNKIKYTFYYIRRDQLIWSLVAAVFTIGITSIGSVFILKRFEHNHMDIVKALFNDN